MSGVPFDSLAPTYQQRVLRYLDAIKDESNPVWLYAVNANYIAKRPEKPHYYVVGESARDAKNRFKNRPAFEDFTVFEVSRVASIDEIEDILKHPYEFLAIF